MEGSSVKLGDKEGGSNSFPPTLQVGKQSINQNLFMFCLIFLNANNILVNFVYVHMFSLQCDHDRFLFGEESKCQSFTVEVIVIKIIIAVINCRHDHHSV